MDINGNTALIKMNTQADRNVGLFFCLAYKALEHIFRQIKRNMKSKEEIEQLADKWLAETLNVVYYGKLGKIK